MDTELRASTDELILLYKLEKEIIDIYVEGQSDRVVIERYLKENDISNINITEIQYVDIPNELLTDTNWSGNKGRLIYFSEKLKSSVEIPNKNVFCIIDADLDRELKLLPDNEFLLVTDFTCMEMYSFNEKCLDKFFDLHYRRDIPHGLIQNFCSILKLAFIIRLEKKRNVPDISWYEITRQCKINEELIQFDHTTFITNLLSSQGKANLIGIFLTTTKKGLPDTVDYRHHAYDDDYIDLLSWYGRASKVKPKYCDRSVVARVLIAFTDIKSLNDYELFKNIKNISEKKSLLSH